MTKPDVLDRYIAALQRDPTAPPPPDLDPAVARALRALLADTTEVPPVGAQNRVWRNALACAKTEQVNHDASRDNAPRPGAWYIHPNGRDKPKKKENNPMQTAITQPKTIPRATSMRRRVRLARLAAAILTIALFTALLLPNLVQDNSPSGPAAVYLSPEAANQVIFERYINEVWNAGNTAVLNDILTADHVCHEPGMPEMVGIDGMVAMITNYRTAFPDWTFTIESLTITDDEVWARLTGTGIHAGPFTTVEGAVVAATGDGVTVEVMLNARFTDGQIAAQWIQSDDLGLLLQTGALPSPQQAITEAHNLAVARRAVEAMDDTAPYDASEYYHEGASWHHGPGKTLPVTYSSAHRSDWVNNELRNAFADFQITIEHITATGDLVIVEAAVQGVFESSFPGVWSSTDLITATGELETWSWVYVYRFEDGKIAEEIWHWDWPTMFAQ